MAEATMVREGVPRRIPDTNTVSDLCFFRLKRKHDDCYRLISKAISFEEQQKFDQAKYFYLKGTAEIEAGMTVKLDNCDEITKRKGTALKQKMKQTKIEADARIYAISSNNQLNGTPVNPVLPTYAEACGESNKNESNTSTMYPSLDNRLSQEANGSNNVMSSLQINEILDDILHENDAEASAPSEHEVLDVLFTANDVQMYFISASGHVSAPSYPAPLRIITDADCNGTVTAANAMPALLQVGSWTYPLLPGKSPILQQDSGCYIFPDVLSPEPGAAVALMLSSTISRGQVKKFDSLMKALTAMQTPGNATSVTQNVPKEQGETSKKIADGLVKGGELVSLGFNKGAQQMSKLFSYGSTKIKEKIMPDSKPQKIDPRVQKGLEIAKTTTGVAVMTTGFLVSKLAEATCALGRAVAPHVERYGNELLGKTSNSKNGEGKMKDVMQIAAGGLKGLAAVYLGLETAGKILAKSLATETVQIVDQKYGKDAAKVTDDSLSSAINLALAARNLTSLGPKSLAKQFAKDTGKAFIQEYKPANRM